jgi:hypothetical protein
MSVEHEFDDAMMGIYQSALSEAGYKASAFLTMLLEHRGFETARRLIHASTVSSGYTALWERNRLDLTVEALIIDDEKWHILFTEDELSTCRRRLAEYRYAAGGS